MSPLRGLAPGRSGRNKGIGYAKFFFFFQVFKFEGSQCCFFLGRRRGRLGINHDPSGRRATGQSPSLTGPGPREVLT